MTNKNSKFAFTLVELLVFMGLFAILIVVLTQILVSALNVQLESQATSSVQQDGRYILARLTYDVNRATKNIGQLSAIIEPASAGTQSDKLQLTINGSTYKYATASGNILNLTVTTGGVPTTNQLNSFGTTITNVVFKRIGSNTNKDSIQASFTATSTSQSSSGPEVKTFQTTAGLRGN